ncbi:uncharacterized protein LOC143345255 [Colletes latitarsis]|uniref:uncharacterized protein LOC143345255 n=1 Tax=Colletes latitarsis TaxID=2605962 RepID=UPI004036AA98
MTSLNREKSRLSDLHLTKYINKNIELKVIKNVLNLNYDILRRKKIVLRDEYMKLDNVNYNVWAIEDQFCNEIWNFSSVHNFNDVFNYYPNMKETITSHDCKYNTAIYNFTKNIDVHKEIVLVELENEIDSINNEITSIRNQDILHDIKNATFILDNLKSFSEKILNLIRLINTSKNSQNICNVPIHQHSRITGGFRNAKKFIKKSCFHSGVLIEKKVTSLNTITERPKTCCNVNNIQFGKFVMKKQSLISLKFQQTPGN